MLQTLQKLIHTVSDVLFPYHCAGCQKVGTILCQGCETNLTTNPEQVSDNIFATFRYGDPTVRQLIWFLKYKNVSQVADKLAPYLLDNLLSITSDDFSLQNYATGRPIILVPVPADKSHRRGRLHNQADLIAQAISRLDDSHTFQTDSRIITKTRSTKPQVECDSRAERKQNLKNAFQITQLKKIKNQVCVVIDDVSTTGTTIGEIKCGLERAGAKKVLGLAVAHG